MLRIEFMENLLKLLVAIEGGDDPLMEPVSLEIARNLVDSVAEFGEEVLPPIHKIFEREASDPEFTLTWGYLAEVLGKIGSSTSIPVLIQYHRRSRSAFNSSIVLRALREIGGNEVFEYMRSIIVKYVEGDSTVVESSTDLKICCEGMKQWESPESIEALKLAVNIEHLEGFPKLPLSLLLGDVSNEYVEELSKEKPHVQDILRDINRESDKLIQYLRSGYRSSNQYNPRRIDIPFIYRSIELVILENADEIEVTRDTISLLRDRTKINELAQKVEDLTLVKEMANLIQGDPVLREFLRITEYSTDKLTVDVIRTG